MILEDMNGCFDGSDHLAHKDIADIDVVGVLLSSQALLYSFLSKRYIDESIVFLEQSPFF